MSGYLGTALSVLACLAGAPPDPQNEDAFGAKLNFLRGQDAREVGRDVKVAEYEKLIEEYPGHPRLAEAMMNVGACWEAHNPEKGFRQDPKMALEWYRRAAAAAPPGSEVWFRSRFYVEGRVVWSDTAEARRILKEIADNAKGDSLTLVRVEHEFQVVCLHENDLDTAEGHCRRVLDWYRDPTHMPKDSRKKSDIDLTIGSAGAVMVSAFASASWPRAERKRRILTLLNDYPWQGLQMDADEAIKSLEFMSEPPPKPDPTPPPSAAAARLPLIGVGTLAVAVLGVGLLLFCYRRRAHA